MCYHNISKNPSHDLTLFSLITIVKMSLTVSTVEPGHAINKSEALHYSMKL